jgi:hypothetical protein
MISFASGNILHDCLVFPFNHVNLIHTHSVLFAVTGSGLICTIENDVSYWYLFSGIQTSLDCRLALTWLFYYWHRLSSLSPSLQASQMMMPTKFELFVLVSSPLSFDKVSIVFLCVYLSS